jgi:inosine/xanthosine triphosphatase
MSWRQNSNFVTNGKIVVAIGSKNPVKFNSSVAGITKALQAIYPDVAVEGVGFNVSSEVSDQPKSDVETKLGATNRAINAWNAFSQDMGQCPDFSVGLEGGIVNDDTEMICSAWMAVFDGVMMGTGRTCSFTLPQAIRELVLGGMELGDADDKIFGSSQNKQKGGTVGHLTRGVIDRTAYYEPAIVLAMVPLLWPDLYTAGSK